MAPCSWPAALLALRLRALSGGDGTCLRPLRVTGRSGGQGAWDVWCSIVCVYNALPCLLQQTLKPWNANDEPLDHGSGCVFDPPCCFGSLSCQTFAYPFPGFNQVCELVTGLVVRFGRASQILTPTHCGRVLITPQEQQIQAVLPAPVVVDSPQLGLNIRGGGARLSAWIGSGRRYRCRGERF